MPKMDKRIINQHLQEIQHAAEHMNNLPPNFDVSLVEIFTAGIKYHLAEINKAVQLSKKDLH